MIVCRLSELICGVLYVALLLFRTVVSMCSFVLSSDVDM